LSDRCICPNVPNAAEIGGSAKSSTYHLSGHEPSTVPPLLHTVVKDTVVKDNCH